ncbi:XdhC family protein [Dyadobacter frigoris]|uniref:XdhC family protein n=1 Tax=Dyadobacter frigoris TaxID=2576211 RepID=A0A4U6CY63_9BACT|nr:XdhC/CoxI family protein [Dyadobacter frigoris]TKT88188.1 XdhC family protein [Dyadobacter frigoris]GLU53808.1 putative xanthine dehydrogenase subunit A [Dyadobacter frigoris]
MKEITDIIEAYHLAIAEGKSMALATVVHVEGSSYRRPGARMLVTEDGQLTGAISGGCLEGDALRKALLAISQQTNKLVTYDTMDDDDDAKFGVQLGCNGIVHILFEPINVDQENHPIALLERATKQRINAILVTLFSMTNRSDQPGTGMLLLDDEEHLIVENQFVKYVDTVIQDSDTALRSEHSLFNTYSFEGNKLTAFIEFLKPPVSLVIVGAGNDVIPLVGMASLLGWTITVVDGRANQATRQRFPLAGKVFVAKSNEVIFQIPSDTQTVFVLMTHNYNYDLGVLREFMKSKNSIYIGSLGPKKKLERMLADLKDDGIEVTEEQISRIYGPVGLDIGAETSEEIALSVLAEIKAVLNKTPGTFLRDKPDVIHSRSVQNIPVLKKRKVQNVLSLPGEEVSGSCGMGPM